uniref:NADH-ubiquinone oxidoreductase chain 4L n=1 Tax=Amphisbaena schmidti TaxID=273519 RepID=Q66SV1_AMPSC|nr:NADH dehydrogenase subunit 4L [Amphisbaena schmidti]AAT08524.1 NADH dehydrogenase subunit 4L [Amphisbaena schmidti]
MTPYFLMMFTALLLALIGMAIHRTHFISVLLCIETMMLTLYFIMAHLALHTSTPTNTTMPLMLLTLSACEAGTGLALLVATVRTHSSDHMNNINMLQC